MVEATVICKGRGAGLAARRRAGTARAGERRRARHWPANVAGGGGELAARPSLLAQRPQQSVLPSVHSTCTDAALQGRVVAARLQEKLERARDDAAEVAEQRDGLARQLAAAGAQVRRSGRGHGCVL